MEIHNFENGKATLRSLLPHRKVLLLLNDVDDISQPKYLVRKQDRFGQGSRVIVITKNEHILILHDAPFSKYEIIFLNEKKSLKLFRHKAFKRN